MSFEQALVGIIFFISAVYVVIEVIDFFSKDKK